MKQPLVSVIMPVYNGAKTLPKAIDSVVSQSIFKDVEIVLIDDGSKDNSVEVIKKHQTKYPGNISFYKNPKNLGIAKTQNVGLKKSQGRYIARLDQDDLWIDDKKLAKQVKAFEQDKKLGLVGTWTKVINEDGPDFVLIPPVEDDKIRRKLLMASMFVAPSVMFRKDLVDEIGYYREDLNYGTEDFEYWLRIGTVARLKNIPDYALAYSFHPSSYSNQNKIKAIGEHLQIIKKYKDKYPGYTKACIKNTVQFNLLKVKFLRKIYNWIVPKIAGKIYS